MAKLYSNGVEGSLEGERIVVWRKEEYGLIDRRFLSQYDLDTKLVLKYPDTKGLILIFPHMRIPQITIAF